MKKLLLHCEKFKLEILFVLLGIALSIPFNALHLFFINHSTNSGFHNYYLIEKVDNNDPLSSLSLKNDRTFFVHPGENEPTEVLIKIKKAGEYNLRLGLQTMTGDGCVYNQEAGVIDVSYRLNHQLQDSILIDRNIKKKHTLNLKEGDIINLKYYNHGGNTTCDWGLLECLPKQHTANFIKLIILLTALMSLIYVLIKLKWYFSIFNFILVFSIYGYAEYITHQYIELRSILIALLLSITVTLAVKATSRFNIRTTIFIFIYTIIFSGIIFPAIIYIAHSHMYQQALRVITLQAMFQTNYQESVEFLLGKLHFGFYFICLAALFLESFLLFKIKKPEKPDVIPQKALLVVILILSIGLYYFIPENKLIHFITKTYTKYTHEIDLLKQEIKERTVNPNFEAIHNQPGETYVLVIGESQNKNHLSLYGYPRNTTPYLKELESQGELIKLKNAFSIHTHTINVLPYALTSAIKTAHDSISTSPSILEVFNKAGFDTYWISNQNKAGAWDNQISVIASSAKHKYYLNKTVGATTESRTYDDQLLPHFEKALQNPKKKLIIVHLMGSHYYYGNRYPAEYFHFPEAISPDTFGLQATTLCNQTDLKEYDNTIRYFDANMREIISKLKANQSVNSLFYFADHADDPEQCIGHDWNNFTWDMTQIGAFFWSSELYKNNYPDTWKNLKNNQKLYFPNDRAFNALIGLAQIQTQTNSSNNDITTDIFKKGKKLYVSDRNYRSNDNPFYNLKENIDFLQDSVLLLTDKKILVHRCNSIGKNLLRQYHGLPDFELDLTFDEEAKTFVVGHGKQQLNSFNFEELLSRMDLNDTKKIWMDVKNFNNNNALAIFDRLEYLDAKFNLKDRVLFESSSTSPQIMRFSEAGYHTSFYLPTQDVLSVLAEKENILKSQLLKQFKTAGYVAISYDIRLSDFVLRKLTPHLPPKIQQHVWILEKGLTQSGFKETIRPYFDKKYDKIKTIIIPWKTKFDF